MHDRSGKVAARSNHTVLLVQNQTGWQNMVKLASAAYLEGFYYKPRIDKRLLADHSAGVIALSACLGGEPNSALMRGDVKGAIRAASEYKEIFGPERYFLEIQNHGLPEEERVRQLMPEVARATGLELVATNDCHFLDADHHEAHDILLAIQTGKSLDDPGRMRSATSEVYFKTTEQMHALFSDWPGALANTVHIAGMVDFDLELNKILLPAFPLPAGFTTAEDYVEHLAREGLARRYGQITDELRERLDFELGVIRTTGYAGYFLIVWDFIDAARGSGTSPWGRAAARPPDRWSATAWASPTSTPSATSCCSSASSTPSASPCRTSTSTSASRSGREIIRYVEDKYGRENVSQIITFGTMAARAVLKDVARVLGLGFAESDRISKLVPEELGITLEKAIAEAPGLKEVAPRVRGPTPCSCATPRCSRASTGTRASTRPAS